MRVAEASGEEGELHAEDRGIPMRREEFRKPRESIDGIRCSPDHWGHRPDRAVRMTISSYSGTELNALTVANNYYRRILSHLAPYVGERVLEVGAGIGTFSDRKHGTQLA